MEIKVEGLDKLVSEFKDMPRNIDNELRVAVRKSAAWIERKAKPITPVARIAGGTLRRQTRMWVYGGLWAEVGARTNYATFVHEGTSKWPLSVPPTLPGAVRQFLKKGTELALPEIEKEFSNAVEKALKK